MSAAAPVLAADRVGKVYPTRFGEKRVLEDVSFDLAMGERLGILGRNGAGKSTLIRLISGAERPTVGDIRRHRSISWPLAFGGAFQPQLTGVDNIRFISRIYAQDFQRNLAFVEEFAELGPYLREPVRSYSSGMRARLAFAISMIIEFDCFLIDEIAAVGDARFHERCNYELFEKRGERAMIIISHDANYLRDHCNRWAVLDAGRMRLFADFGEAQGHFLERLKVTQVERTAALPFSRRMAALDALQRIALDDEHFMALVREADGARDRKDWAAAEAGYAAALSHHPYERSYWVQLGHVAREQGRSVRAEIAYRTACALGEPARQVAPFVAAVAQQPGGAVGLAEPDSGATRQQPPAYPDLVLLAAFARGDEQLSDEEALALLTGRASIEAVLTDMLASGASAAAPARDLPEAVLMVPVAGSPARTAWREDLARLVGARHEAFAAALARGAEPLDALVAAGGLAGWDVPLATTAA